MIVEWPPFLMAIVWVISPRGIKKNILSLWTKRIYLKFKSACLMKPNLVVQGRHQIDIGASKS